MDELEIMSISNENQLYLDFTAHPLATAPDSKSVNRSKKFSGQALLDCGATSCFINPSLAKEANLPLFNTKNQRLCKL